MLWNRAWLYFIQKKEEPPVEPVIEWVTNVATARGNNFEIDNTNKTVIVYKRYASNGTTLYNMDFIPEVLEGYEPVKPEGLGVYSTYWRKGASGNDNQTFKYTFDIINSSTNEVVATYSLTLDFTSTGG